MAEQLLKAEYFVTRKDGKMVPLVAVDELPHHISVAGVSRVMSPFDIAGMTCIGRSDFRHRHFSVKRAPELAASNATFGRDVLKARYFVTRDSGNMVPLLAMDEMPEHFVIDGVPRTISVFDIAGMKCVGLEDARDLVHTVEDVNNAPMSYFTEKTNSEYNSVRSNSVPDTPKPRYDSSSLNDEITESTENSTSPRTNPSSTPSQNFTMESRLNSTEPAPLIFNTPEYSARPGSSVSFDLLTSTPILSPAPLNTASKPTTNVSALGQKKYCSYWIRHGECDYQQQGCLYKHEMPLDAETLAKLGLRDIPRWYREKHCLGSYLAAGGAGASFSGPGLKSAVAAGVQRQENSKIMTDWRSGQPNTFSPPPPPPSNGPRGFGYPTSIYNPRPTPFTMSPHSFSRFPAGSQPPPSSNGNHQSAHGRHQFGGPLRANTGRPQFGRPTSRPESSSGNNGIFTPSFGSSFGHARNKSASTIISDIEALVGREDAERRAKEDAAYAKVVEEANRKKAVENAKTALEAKSGNHKTTGMSTRGARMTRGMYGRGRAGHRGSRVGGKPYDDKPAAT